MPAGMYGQASGALPPQASPNALAQMGGPRDRITRALMDVQNPQPVTPMTQQRGMPGATGAPPMAGAMPTAAAPQAMGGMPGQLPPLVGQGGAMPGLMQQPQAMPGLMQQPRTPTGPTY